MPATKKKELTDLKADDAPAAVIIADSFDSAFGPAAENTPRVRNYANVT